ncbi:MAG: outer membrane protein assembly factor BamB [Burkholderiales bacterium]
MTGLASLRRLGIGVIAAVLTACSTTDKPKPTPLEALQPTVQVQQVWRHSMGQPVAGLRMVALPDRVVLAAEDGTVLMLDAATGAERLRAKVSGGLSAGVGSDGRFVAVVTRDNELVVLEGATERWRARLNARVVTPPLVAGERVFVQGTDRVVEAFDAIDGRKLWTLNRSSDPLALAQPGLLVAYKDTLLAGVGPKLVGVEPLLGTVRSEGSMATPRGTNEVERLADLVGPAARQGDVMCARAFQSAVTCVNVERGNLLWSRNVGGYQGVAADADYVFAADASDRISAWRMASGDVAWTSERLRYRGLSAPLVVGSMVLWGDAEGYVHFLSRDKGDTLQRLPTDGSAIAAPLVRVGATVVVVTRSGGVFAFRAQ